jgi:hypothetical protein
MNVRLKCTDHPRYKIRRPPRGNCEACWFLYFIKTESVYVFDKDLSEVSIDVKTDD